MTAASRHGEHDPPKRRAIPAANAPSISTTAATRSGVGAGPANSTPSCAATAASTAKTRSATTAIRRSQPRTVEAGTASSTATRRCPSPLALASNPAPITVTASARRSNTLAGSSTCVAPQPPHRALRGSNRPTPRTTLSRAEPHGRSTPPQPTTGHPKKPAHKSNSTAEAFTPTVITGCTPMHQDGPSVSTKTFGRAVAYFQDVLTLTSHTNSSKTPAEQTQLPQQDQPTMTRSSSGSLAVNTRKTTKVPV